MPRPRRSSLDDSSSNVEESPPDAIGVTSRTRVAVGAFLKQKRKDAGWGTSALASAIGVHQGTIIAYENGRVAVSRFRLVAIANALNVDCDLLIEEVSAICL